MTQHDVDVLIIGSGPVGATYARTIGDEWPGARILMVEVGPAVPGGRGTHTQNMSEADRTAAQPLSQGPDAGVARTMAIADIAPGGELPPVIVPGLFPVDPDQTPAGGEIGLPGASMASCVGGMGIHWATSCPRPVPSERIPFIPGDELETALDHAESLLGGVIRNDAPSGLFGALHKAMADVFDATASNPTLTSVALAWRAARRLARELILAGESDG